MPAEVESRPGAGVHRLRCALAGHLIICYSRVHRGWGSTSLGADLAEAIVRRSGTAACVLHVPIADDLIGEGIPFDVQRSWFPSHRPIVFFNTSGANDHRDCIDVIQMLHAWANGIPEVQGNHLFKLEVFDSDLRCVDDEVLQAISGLSAELRSLCVPIIEPRPDVAHELVSLGVAGLRLRAGSIRQSSGIVAADACRETISAVRGRVPIVIEGGLRSAEDVRLAARLGADGVLFNTAIAEHPRPLELIDELCAAAAEAW